MYTEFPLSSLNVSDVLHVNQLNATRFNDCFILCERLKMV